jgi:hypothetical protein
VRERAGGVGERWHPRCCAGCTSCSTWQRDRLAFVLLVFQKASSLRKPKGQLPRASPDRARTAWLCESLLPNRVLAGSRASVR